MKKYRIALTTLIITAMLAGCAKNNDAEQTSETSAGETTAALTEMSSTLTEESIVTDESAETPVEEKSDESFNLKNLTDEEKETLIGKLIALTDENGEQIFSQEVVAASFTAVSENEFSADSAVIMPLFRSSSMASCSDESKEADFHAQIDSREVYRYAHDISGEDSYNATDSPVIIRLNVNEQLEPEIIGITAGYSIENVSFNAFVEKSKAGGFNVIIDPAYMYNIPMPIFANDFSFVIKVTVKIFRCK